MKKLLLLTASLLLLSLSSFAQKNLKLKEYSFSEFYRMMLEGDEEVFSLENAVIKMDTLSDKKYLLEEDGSTLGRFLRGDSIVVDKEVRLKNIIFNATRNGNNKYYARIYQTRFNRKVNIQNCYGWFVSNTFESGLEVNFDEAANDLVRSYYGDLINPLLTFDQSVIKTEFVASSDSEKGQIPIQLGFTNNYFSLQSLFGYSRIGVFQLFNFYFENNELTSNEGFFIGGGSNQFFDIIENQFNDTYLMLNFAEGQNGSTKFTGNSVDKLITLGIPESIQNIRIDWEQFDNGLMSSNAFFTYFDNFNDEDFFSSEKVNLAQKIYLDSICVVDKTAYKTEISMLGTLNTIYKRQHDLESANASYIKLKDLETDRLGYLFKADRSFDNFFEWKVNQFLKVFSAYGTRPAKAITFSVNVIIFFALIYLFFPNNWDSHGRNRLMDRYRFFLKYVNKDSGMHEVYLEDKQPELLASEDFKAYLQEQGKTAPRFFTITAMPLYRWSLAGTNTYSWILSKIDVLKGKWSDTDPSKQRGKTFILIVAFMFAIAYDIFIKILNALMLSINTFTTLGFGEIPIKGLPRYLAIIQGFIGWFMLTIFSVSLISQLLN